MVQIVCSVAESLASSGVSGFSGWLLIWGCYTLFAYLFYSTMYIPWFVYFYGYPRYETWRNKSNPKYPSPIMVLGEIFLGVFLANPSVAFPPSIHMALIANGTLRHHCDTPQTWGYRLYSFLLVFIVVDIYSWAWHYLGHYVGSLWAVHRHHHHFPNPTPFSTIADLPPDNIVRSAYMVIVNIVSCCLIGLPADVDVVYLVTSLTAGCYGMYLHCGHEFACLPYDHKFINTSFQHYAHHAMSYKNKPYHTGFVFKFWDNLAGSRYEGTQCVPAVEDQKLGNRSLERWEKEIKPNLPDYSVLLSPTFIKQNWRQAFAMVLGLDDKLAGKSR